MTSDRECLQEKIPEWLCAIATEKISDQGEDLWTVTRRRSIALMFEHLEEKILEWLHAIATEKISNQGEDLWTVMCRRSDVLTHDHDDRLRV